ncbi:cytochrome c [Gallaecimonas sp. GXIMD4217]|uniref:c-type cytochrome n=1 Tax=Gallaecimonas sp. GXIMD4217 TaxID=3131927 RepID=UPI00311ABBC5
MMRKYALAAALAAPLLASPLAQAFDDKDEAIDYRRSVFSLVAKHFGEMAAMVKGKKDFNAEEFQYRAESLKALSHMPLEGFLYPGADKGDTKARAEVWENTEEFKKRLSGFQADTVALLDKAKSGDLNAIKPAFVAAAKNCKACHKDFKNR